MSHPIKLFGLRGSVFTRYALFALDEAGVQYDMTIVPLDQLKSAENLARHPFGKVPILHDGDFQLFEIRAIGRYIASQYDKKGNLYPTDPRKRALVEQWISVEQSYFRAAEEVAVELIFSKIFGFEGNSEKARDATERLKKTLEVLDRHLATSTYSVEQSYFRAAEEIAVQLIFSKLFGYEPDLEKARDATERLKNTLQILDRHLATSTYFAGDTFTLADIVYTPFTHLLYNNDFAELFNSYKNFARWWKLVSERPTWKNIAAQSEF